MNMIPTPNILPLPGPVWLFELLLMVVFLLHVLFMNMLFGGVILGAIGGMRGNKSPNQLLLSRKVFKFLPVVIAFTVTMGVAPLLFVQILYGHLLYSSSILMATMWFAVVPILILAYYGAYALRFGWDKLEARRKPIMVTVAVLIATIAFMFVNNFSLVNRPDTWVSHYFQNPSIGSLNFGDASLWPRYLHMLAGAVAVAGVWIMLIGVRGKSGDAEWSRWAIIYGGKMFAHATMGNILIGLWFLMALPKPVMMTFMGGNHIASAALMLGLALTVIALVCMRKARNAEQPKTWIYRGLFSTISLVLVMLVMRLYLRKAALAPHFQLSDLQVATQWDALLWFLGLFVFVLIPSMVWLIRVAMRASTTSTS